MSTSSTPPSSRARPNARGRRRSSLPLPTIPRPGRCGSAAGCSTGRICARRERCLVSNSDETAEAAMIVRQAAYVLDVLEYFAQSKRPATLAEVADHFGWPRSSTFNLLTTLSEKGYLYEPRPRAGYYPTPKWLAMARMIAEVEPLPAWTHVLVVELSAQTGETVAIAAPAGTMAV